MQLDMKWLAEYIGNLVLHCAVERGNSAQQLALKEQMISDLKIQVHNASADAPAEDSEPS